MATAREWLVSQGLAKPGRGKFSKAAHQALAKALGEGIKFSDYPKSANPAPVKTVKATGDKPAPTPVKSSSVPDVMFEDEYRYPEADYQAVRFEDGKKIVHSMREVCNNCRVSLVMCGCEDTTIYGRLKVKIVAKK